MVVEVRTDVHIVNSRLTIIAVDLVHSLGDLVVQVIHYSIKFLSEAHSEIHIVLAVARLIRVRAISCPPVIEGCVVAIR